MIPDPQPTSTCFQTANWPPTVLGCVISTPIPSLQGSTCAHWCLVAGNYSCPTAYFAKPYTELFSGCELLPGVSLLGLGWTAGLSLRTPLPRQHLTLTPIKGMIGVQRDLPDSGQKGGVVGERGSVWESSLGTRESLAPRSWTQPAFLLSSMLSDWSGATRPAGTPTAFSIQ